MPLSIKNNVGYPNLSLNYETARIIADLLNEGIIHAESQTLIMRDTEAVKLFSNTYLAMLVSFFNEMDSYAELKGVNTKEIIAGVKLDSRKESHYNNPSFGYGGHCPPKDSKHLLANYGDIPQELISAIVSANETWKNHIAAQVLKCNPRIVDIYRLTMKSNSDNFRESSIQDVMRKIDSHKVIICELMLASQKYAGYYVVANLKKFAEESGVIIANRMDTVIQPYIKKCIHENYS